MPCKDMGPEWITVGLGLADKEAYIERQSVIPIG